MTLFRHLSGCRGFRPFTVVESGGKDARRGLTKALLRAKLNGATLVIAKLDRLIRNAVFLLALRDSRVRFLAVDMPEANDLTVGIMALVVQQEREVISRRTKEAQAATKAHDVKLGNPNGTQALQRAGKGARADHRSGARMAARQLDPQPDLSEGRREPERSSTRLVQSAGHRRRTTLARSSAQRTACLKKVPGSCAIPVPLSGTSHMPESGGGTDRKNGGLFWLALPALSASAR